MPAFWIIDCSPKLRLCPPTPVFPAVSWQPLLDRLRCLAATSVAVGMASLSRGRLSEETASSCRWKRAARRPSPERPHANGPPLPQWPDRVAVVAYGRWAQYGQYGDNDQLLLVDRCGVPERPGTVEQMVVASPHDIQRWADANQVRVQTCHHCYRLVVYQSIQTRWGICC